MTPTVSVLMSNYKTPPAFLKKALDSVLEQTFRDFEIVMINDGIKDESYEILREYAAADSRMVLIENERNLGLAASLNRGLQFCRGTYIARMDTDDICVPDRLEKQVSFMDEHPEYLFSGAWADVFEGGEENVTKHWKPVMCPPEEYRIHLLFANEPLMIHPTVIFRRELLEKNGLRYDTDDAYRYSEDYRMWVKCSRVGIAGILEYPVLHYRNTNTADRITVRHMEEMQKCSFRVQAEQLKHLEIELTEDTYRLHSFLLTGRKPYDPAYKEWIDRILEQNRIHQVYAEPLLTKILHDRWYTITWYGIANEKSLGKRIRYYLDLYPDGKKRFLKDMAYRIVGKKVV